MCSPKNFTDVLRTLTLYNANRLLLLKYLVKIKIAALHKFSKGAACRFFKIDILKYFPIVTKKYLC